MLFLLFWLEFNCVHRVLRKKNEKGSLDDRDEQLALNWTAMLAVVFLVQTNEMRFGIRQ
jgi:hypothetical protein